MFLLCVFCVKAVCVVFFYVLKDKIKSQSHPIYTQYNHVYAPLGVHRRLHHPLVGEGVKHLHVTQMFIPIMTPHCIDLA